MSDASRQPRYQSDPESATLEYLAALGFRPIAPSGPRSNWAKMRAVLAFDFHRPPEPIR